MKRKIAVGLMRFLVNLLTDLEFKGAENIPTEGGIVITTNHLSLIDTPVLAMLPNRPDITALIAKEYLRKPFIGFILKSAGGIFIDRSRADFKAFHEAMQVVKNDGTLGIAPEGTRSRTGQLIEGKPGTALLVIKANVPIIPVAITGTDTAREKLLSFKRPQIKVKIGPAYYLSPIDMNNRDKDLQQKTDEIMCRIAALLPEDYRGVYSQNPLVKKYLEFSNI